MQNLKLYFSFTESEFRFQQDLQVIHMHVKMEEAQRQMIESLKDITGGECWVYSPT